MRLGTKLLLISEIVLLVLVIVILVPVRDQMRKQVIDDMQNELRAIAATAALQIDGDLHQAAATAGTPDTAEFKALRELLMDIRRSNSPAERPELALTADNIYTFYHDEVGGLRFGIMTQDPFIGDPYDVHPHQAMALASGMPYASELYNDDYGQWISAVAPIRNSANEVVGLLEVNRQAESYFARYDNVVLLTTAMAVIGLAISSLLGYVVLRWLILRPVNEIHNGMEALGRHDFSHRVEIRSRDEFQVLSVSPRTWNSATRSTTCSGSSTSPGRSRRTSSPRSCPTASTTTSPAAAIPATRPAATTSTSSTSTAGGSRSSSPTSPGTGWARRC
jgi:methyl-accepting chemotaxis protein